MKLRYYQEAAVEATYDWLNANNGNCLVVVPTGGGKSIIMAEIIRRAIKIDPSVRIICATHNATLVDQNYKEYVGIEPLADAGIFSSSLKRRDKHNQVVFANIQSIYKRAILLQRCDLLLIDEAHTLSVKSDTMWMQFIMEMLKCSPFMRVVGMTATPYRLKGGPLVGAGMFHGVSYEYELGQAVKDGFLAPVFCRDPAGLGYDVKGVSVVAGEFVESELNERINSDSKNRQIATDIARHGKSRRTWMVFCGGVAHAFAMRDAIRELGFSCETVVGTTSQDERERIYAALKNGSLRCATSVGVMTTGTNIPPIDLIADCAPTMSGGLVVQKAGRGMRLSPDTGKQNCLYLDYALNIERHGPIDLIKGKLPSNGSGPPPSKVCPNKVLDEDGEETICNTINHAAAKTCEKCGFEFPFSEKEDKLVCTAPDVAVMSQQEKPQFHKVTKVTYDLHKKDDKLFPTLKVTYYCGDFARYSEWICLSHPSGSMPRGKAYSWWKKRSAQPVPPSVEEALREKPLGIVNIRPVDMLDTPYAIGVLKEDKYWRVVEYQFEPPEESSPLDATGHAGNQSAPDDFDIPF